MNNVSESWKFSFSLRRIQGQDQCVSVSDVTFTKSPEDYPDPSHITESGRGGGAPERGDGRSCASVSCLGSS